MASNFKKIPRAEHPQPQAFRATWQTLNGEWQYEETNRINIDKKFLKAKNLKEKIEQKNMFLKFYNYL